MRKYSRLALIAFALNFSLVHSLELYDDQIARTLSKLPNWDFSNSSIQKIEGGLTNINYKAKVDSSDYFVRCSSSQNHFLETDLEREWLCHSLAAEMRITPQIVLYAPEDQILITTFVKTTKNVDLRNPLTQSKFCNLIRSMHLNSSIQFPNTFCPFECINQYINNALTLEAPLPPILLDQILPKIEHLKFKVTPLYSKPTPCHLDLHHGNILDDGSNLWLIDWEYAAMSDPLFDLAVVTSTENFSEEEMKNILTTYLEDEPPSPSQLQYFYFMRVLSDIRWATWEYIQFKISPIDYPFTANGDIFLEHAQKYLDLLEA